MSIFAGELIDSLSGPELYAFHRESVSGFRAFRFYRPKMHLLEPSWHGNDRINWFDASLLKTPAKDAQRRLAIFISILTLLKEAMRSRDLR